MKWSNSEMWKKPQTIGDVTQAPQANKTGNLGA